MPPNRHPDDITTERRLAEQLRDARRSARLTQPQVAAAAGLDYQAVISIERRRRPGSRAGTSRCDTYAAVARGVCGRLAYQTTGLPVVVPGLWAANLTAMADAADTWDRHDALTLSAFIAHLVDVREHLGWTISEVARRRGVTYWSVEKFEDERSTSPLLATVQAHVRALGGVLVPQLVPAVVEVAA